MCHMMSHVSNKPTMLHVNEGGVCVSHDVACEQQTYNATCKRGRHVCHMMLHVSNKPTMLHVNEGGVCVT